MRAVVVDGVEIPETLLAQEVQNHPSASAAESRAAAGHALAIKALLLHRGRELGLAPQTEVDEEGREETAEEALVRAVLEAEVDVASPGAEECRRVYDAQRARFCSPQLYEASHILIEVKGDRPDADAAARAAAERAIAALNGHCSFAELASDLSACPSGAVGGSLGQLRPGDVVSEVERALDALTPGQVAPEPVRSRFGWHVLRLDRRIEGRELPFEYVEDRIRLHLESRAWTAAAARYVAELAEDARSRGIALTLRENGAVARGSLTLGEVLAGGRVADRLEPWLAATDPALGERIAVAASAAGLGATEFVQASVAEFVSGADDDAWTQLISAAQGAEDPALACLAALLRSKVEPPKRTFTVIRRV
ncbi:MAG TPA: peptidylprolyl isomerase [Caulobacteraceae bacterium]